MKKKTLNILAVLLMAVFALTLMFGFACNKNKDDDTSGDNDEPEITVPDDGGSGSGDGGDGGDEESQHQHDYVSEKGWVWAVDETTGTVTCTRTWTCQSTDKAECDAPTKTDEAEVTSKETAPTCTEAGKTVYSATFGDETIDDYEVPGADALGHTYPDPASEDEKVASCIVWGWTSRTDTTVKLTLSCTVCGTEIYTGDVAYTSGGDMLSATATSIEGCDYTYSSTHDASEDEGAEHEHNYTLQWDWADDCTNCTLTATCESVVGTCPDEEKVLMLTAEITSEVTKQPTCEEKGETTYTATVEGHSEWTDTKTLDNIDALGHAWVIDETSWQWDVDNDPMTASVTFNCSNDSDHSQTVTGTPVVMGADSYTVTVTGPDGNTYTGTYTPEPEEIELPSVTLDFGDSETYSWLNPDADGNLAHGQTLVSENDLLTLQTKSSGNSYMQVKQVGSDADDPYALNTNGTTSSSAGYFEIDLSGYEGKYVSVNVVMSNTGSSDTRSLLLATEKVSDIAGSGVLAYVSSSKKSGGQETLEYVTQITKDYGTLYVCWTNSIYIYSVDVEVLEDATPTPAVGEVTLTPGTANLTVEDGDIGSATLTMTVTMVEGGTYAGGYTVTVTETPDDEDGEDSVIELTDNGDGTFTVTAMSAGSATITVRLWNDASKTATCEITVAAAEGEASVKSIATEPESPISVEVGETVTVQVTVTMDDETTSENFGYSFEQDFITVTKSGSTLTITASAAGTANILLTAGEKSITLVVNVTEPAPTVADVTLNTNTLTIDQTSDEDEEDANFEDLGQILTATVTMSDGSAYSGEYTWTVEGSVDTIIKDITNETGKTVTIIGKSYGTVTVTVTVGDYSASCGVTVNPRILSVTLTPDNASVEQGKTVDITATVEMEDGNPYTGTYLWDWDGTHLSATYDDTTSTLTFTGLAPTMEAQDGYISVECGGVRATMIYVTVTAIPDYITISASGDITAEGESMTLTAVVHMTNGMTNFQGELFWETSNANVASLSATSGSSVTVTAVDLSQSQSATITVSIAGSNISASYELIIEAEHTVVSVTLTDSASLLQETSDGNYTLALTGMDSEDNITVTVLMSNGTYDNSNFTYEITPTGILWNSKSSNIIGLMSCVTDGEAQIAITAGDITVTVYVTIGNPSAGESEGVTITVDDLVSSYILTSGMHTEDVRLYEDGGVKLTMKTCDGNWECYVRTPSELQDVNFGEYGHGIDFYNDYSCGPETSDGIEIVVESDCTVIIYAASYENDTLYLLNGSGETVETVTLTGEVTGYTFTLDAGTYCFSANEAWDFFAIQIV